MAFDALKNAMKIHSASIENEMNSILRPLTEKQNAVRKTLKALAGLSNQIQTKSTKYEEEIATHFDKIIQQIEGIKKQCCGRISLITNKKLSEIDKQRQMMSKDEQNISDALKLCKAILTDSKSTLSPLDKKKKVKSMSNDILDRLSENKTSPIPITNSIKYKLDSPDRTLLPSLCIIDDENLLHPLPNITDFKLDSITDNSARIVWNAKVEKEKKHKAELWMTLKIKCDDLSDQKDEEMDILFDQDTSEYFHRFNNLNQNKTYSVSLQMKEDNMKRTDFESIHTEFKTKKERPKMSSFKFEKSSSTMKVSDDGLSVTGHGQLRFGKYLKAENRQILKIWLSMKDVEPEHCGIGFATKGFINSHNNHRILVYGNKKVLMAKEFRNGTELAMEYWQKGEVVLIEINMKKKMGKMYRQTRDQQGIQVIDEFYKVDLPDTVAICVRLSPKMTQTLTVIKQQLA